MKQLKHLSKPGRTWWEEIPNKQKKKGTLTLSKMEELYKEAKKGEICEKYGCHRKVRYVYFVDGGSIYSCCMYHQLKESKK